MADIEHANDRFLTGGTAAAGIAALFFLLLLANPEWIYNFTDWVDGWAYFGVTLHPLAMRRAFPDRAIGDLLPLIIPPGLLYAAFAPFWANFLYKLASFFAAGWLMWKTLEMEFGRRTAVLGTLSFLLYKGTLAAIGQDYTDGRVIIFYLAAIFCALKAAQDERPGRWLFLGGVSYCLSVSTALLSAVYLPVLAILHYGKKLQLRRDIRALPEWNALWMAAGFLLCAAALGLVSMLAGGDFIYFRNTLQKAAAFLGQRRGPDFAWFGYNWLSIPMYTLCLGGVCAAIRLFSPAEDRLSWLRERWFLFCAAIGATLSIMAYLQVFRGQNGLFDPYYFNQTLPLTFLGMSALFYAPFADRLSARAFWTVSSLLAAAGIVQFAIYSTNWNSAPLDLNTFSLRPAAAWAASCAAVMLCWKARWQAAFFAAAFFALNFSPEPGWRLLRDRNNTVVKNRRAAMDMAVDWIREMDKADPSRKAWLWYDRDGSGNYMGGLAGASHLWQFRVFNEALPECNAVMGEVGRINPRELLKQPLIIMADKPEKYLAGKASLAALGINLSCDGGTPFVSHGSAYFTYYVCSAK